MTDKPKTPELPKAVLKPQRRPSLIWLVPVLAACLAGWLGYGAWASRGLIITVDLEQGFGLRDGDEVRYRGIAVGQIRSVEVADDLDGIRITAGLHARAQHLARAGARFWVVRPQLDITGVAGLETLVGPRYLAVLPGDGPPRRRFVGLGGPPILEATDGGGLEIILHTTRRKSLRPGAPVLYRQVRIGTVLSVGLTSDGGAVEARAHVHKAYTQLIRPETRFWNVGGLEASVGIRGVDVHIESIETLLAGGVAMATPPHAGDVVRTGHRFDLALEPQKEWLEWEPLVVIGSSFLPPGAVMPAPMRGVVSWQRDNWLGSEKSRRGWVLQTDRGLLGPADLLISVDEAEPGSVVLEVAGDQLSLTAKPLYNDNGLALIDATVSRLPWPGRLQRTPSEPEDCLAVADPAATPLPLAASRLTPDQKTWLIDPAVAVDDYWHGACVLARSDGRLVGMILVTNDAAHVALLPDR